jgi:hypothetical protein
MSHDTKTCPQCHAVKPLADFPVNRRRPDGRAGWCRLCTRAYLKRHGDELRARALAREAAERGTVVA